MKTFFTLEKWILPPLFMAVMTACSSHRVSQNQTYLARVGSSYLTLKEAKEEIPDYVFHYDSLQALKRYRNQWINRQLALREAKDLDLSDQKSVQKRLAKARQEVLLGALKRLVIAKHKKKLTVSDSEAISYFNRHQKQLTLDERYIKFREVGAHDLSTARKAKTELQNDSSWVKVAHKYSLKPEAMIQKSTEYWPISSVFHHLPLMKHYASRLDSGQISPIRRSNGIYHFIQLTGVLAKGERGNPKWFIDQLKEWYLLEKQQNYYKTYLQKLYFKAKQNDDIELFDIDKHNP
jgi:hypothetical protein